MKNKSLIISGVLVIIFAGIGFYGGMKYQLSKEPAFLRSGTVNGARTGNGTVAANRGGTGTGFRPVTGSIISADANSITVKLTDGSSKIVLINSSTQVNQATQAVASDLKVGIMVAAYGQQNSDGSVSAQSIQINPQELRPTGQQNNQPTPTPTQ